MASTLTYRGRYSAHRSLGPVTLSLTAAGYIPEVDAQAAINHHHDSIILGVDVHPDIAFHILDSIGPAASDTKQTPSTCTPTSEPVAMPAPTRLAAPLSL